MNNYLKYLRKKSNFQLLKLFMLLIIFTMSAINSAAQVAINEDDSNGNPAADLDIKSTTKGVIFPVMTEVDRNAIQSPANGLLIFNRTGGYHNYYNGSNWLQIDRAVVTAATNPTAGTGTDIGVGVGIADPDNSAILHINSTTKGFLLPISGNGTAPSNVTGLIYYNDVSNTILFYNGTDWKQVNTTSTGVSGAGGTNTPAGVLIGTGTIEASAKMEVRPTENKGLLIPRMTAAQRDAIDSPYEGLTIYDTDNNEIEYFAALTWYKWANVTNNYGQIISNPGLSCKDIYNQNPATNGFNGTYYIDPDGTGSNAAYECYCDMTTDGGGWTLVENTGPKGSANNNSAAIGTLPILPTDLSLKKLSDSDINLIRGTYSTSILRVEKPKCCNTNTIYFKQNRIFNSTSTNNTQSIRTYYTSYANAVSSTGMQTGISNYGSAFDTWYGGTSGYQIIFRYGSEGFIYNGCNSSHSDCTTVNRSVCGVLVWIK